MTPPVRQVNSSYFTGWVTNCTQYDEQDGVAGARNAYMNKSGDCSDDSKREKTSTIQACVSDPNEFEYFASGKKACDWQPDIFPWDQLRPVSGPQFNCPTAMLGLSESPKQVYEKLDHMYPVPGGTQLDVGLMWGLRALSPRKEWTEFFGYDNDAKPRDFSLTENRKIMIVLTDGENVAPYHYEGYYGCFDDTDRWGAGDCWQSKGTPNLTTKGLDNLTIDACDAIRDDYGVEIYTVAVDVKKKAALKTMEKCAGDKSRAYDVTGDELKSTFEMLAMRSLRLTK